MARFLSNLFKNLLIERPASRSSYTQLVARLEQSAARLEQRLDRAADTPKNRTQLRHIVGTERWGQRRLRVALGEPPVFDEMDGYLPRSAAPTELCAALAAARRETIVLAQQLEARRISGDTLINHSLFGPLTVRGWLVYLDTHASRAAKRVKR